MGGTTDTAHIRPFRDEMCAFLYRKGEMNLKETEKLNWASALIVFGTALTWTGLPALLYLKTGSIIFSSLFFVSASIARILASLFAGYLVDQMSSKRLTLISLLGANGGLILLLVFLVLDQYLVGFLLMMGIQFLSSVYSMSKAIWYRTLLHKDQLIQGISKMNSFEMTSKTLGFTLGPVIFLWLNLGSLALNSILALIAAFLILKIPYSEISHGHKSQSVISDWKQALTLIKENSLLKNYAFVTFLNGIIVPTLLSMATVVLVERYNSTSTNLSLFWLFSGLGVIVANMFMTRLDIKKWPLKRYAFIIIITMTGGLITLTIAPKYNLFLLGFLALTFSGPMIMNVLKAELFRLTEGKSRGKILSLIQAGSDFGTLVMILISWVVIDHGYINIFLVGLTFLSVLLITVFLIQIKQSNKTQREKVNQGDLTIQTN